MALPVLVTREHAEPLAAALAARGLVPVHRPLVCLVATGIAPPCAAPAQILLTSAAAVAHAADLATWAVRARVVAVGDKTARAARRAGLEVCTVGRAGGAQALGLLDSSLAPTVFVGAARPASAVAAALTEGALLHWAVYDRVLPQPDQDPPQVALVTLTSPSAAHAWARQPGASGVPAVVIGQTTAAAARADGIRVVGIAATPDLGALADAAAIALGVAG